MIRAKKLAHGKISFKLDYVAADEISGLIMSYLETESVNILSVRIEKDPARWLMYYTVDELYRKHSGKLLSASTEHNYVLERSEALALVWLLRNEKNGPIITAAFELKTTLHKLLS